MNQIPCEIDKCILLPLCKNKEIIECDKLYNNVRINTNRKNKTPYYEQLREKFPNTDYVSKINGYVRLNISSFIFKRD